jgi:hypothetical protein
MRAIGTLSILPLALVALACGDRKTRPDGVALSEDLRRDLELAKSGGLELASSAQTFQRAQVVSAIELPPPAPPRPSKTTKKPLRPRPAPAPKPAVSPDLRAVPEPVAEPQVAEVTPEAQAPEQVPTIEAEPAAEPLPARRPRPIPVSFPGDGDVAMEGEEEGQGGGVVVIRGGGVGEDKCELHPRGRRWPGGSLPLPGGEILDDRPTITMGGRVPVAINDRLPVGRPTFPRW